QGLDRSHLAEAVRRRWPVQRRSPDPGRGDAGPRLPVPAARHGHPHAGSDLASLRTRAVLQGDHFLVNGHKIWTSNAHMSDWIFCLVRTDPTAKKHEGISFLLIDMADPGVRPNPIRLISGASVFCETFIENVRVPVGNLVGPLNKGWTIAKRLLEHDRKGIGGIAARNAAKFEIPVEAAAKHYAGEHEGKI